MRPGDWLGDGEGTLAKPRVVLLRQDRSAASSMVVTFSVIALRTLVISSLA
jgi:hypothetical protein